MVSNHAINVGFMDHAIALATTLRGWATGKTVADVASTGISGTEEKPFIRGAAGVLCYYDEGHTEINVSNDVFQPAEGYEYKQKLSESIARAAMGHPLLHFELSLPENEAKRLDEHVSSSPFRLQTCVEGASLAVSQNTGLLIPYPFSASPLLNGAYLFTLYAMGSERVSGIAHYGHPKPALLLRTLAKEAVMVVIAPAVYLGFRIIEKLDPRYRWNIHGVIQWPCLK